ncbi:MAG: efflux RND transporter periplasmic adaptor subunit [Magnetococcales bacterium]|nr:efflux RND transporter periplasmic adaptor subunit [Magnetococcales bacterium]
MVKFKALLFAGVMIGLWCGAAKGVLAHGGEDHGGDLPMESLTSDLGVSGTGDFYEAVITPAKDGLMRLYLTNLADNTPVQNAVIEGEVTGPSPWKGVGKTTSFPGVYQLDWQSTLTEPVDLTLTLSASNQSDLILIQVPSRSASKAVGRVVNLPMASQFLLGMQTVPAEKREVAETIRLVGRVIPNPAAHARVHPSVPSRIGYDPNFPPPRSGQVVKKGQTLAILDPILSAMDRAGQRQALFKGERSDSAMGREMILAPMDGQITDIHIVPGEVVNESILLAEIFDPARLWVEAVLYDISLANRIVGGTASSRQIPGYTIPLNLVGVSPKINPENQGLHLQFEVKENQEVLKPGMPLDVYAQTGLLSYAVAIPWDTVLDRSGVPQVWIKSAPERFEARPVRVGRHTAAWAEILAGLQPGDRVVTQGHNQLNAMR